MIFSCCGSPRKTQKPCSGVASRPDGREDRGRRGYATVVFTVVVAVFVLLVVKVSSAMAIVHPEA
jgi:hypothetical protein